ncbi:uncharacterized protein [Nicotiana tomentosiformis]|uniref:uncharacterized protein n=1 Tax=Nicotiana tomentosiformis TaxID=4098 RepID=UPI00388C75BB
MAVESKAAEYDSIFALMARSDNDKDDDDDDMVNFLDIQRNLKSYSPKKTQHERDDLVVVVVDLKETIECVKKEKEALTEKVANIEHERDDLLVVVVDLKDTIEELKGEGRHEILQKGKEVADETHLRLEDQIKSVKSSLCVELKKNKQLQEELIRVKSDLEKSLKWTWFSEAITAMYTNNGGNRQGIEFQRGKTPYNPHSKYATVPDNWLCTHCGNTGNFKKTCKAKFQSQQKNKVFAKMIITVREPGPSYKRSMMPAWTKRTGTVKGSSQQWYMDSGCSKHMTGSTNDFLSLKDLQGGIHSGSWKDWEGNKVEFVSKICTVTNLVTGGVVLVAKRYKNIYVADFESLQRGNLSCLSVVDDDAELWNKRLGHASFM